VYSAQGEQKTIGRNKVWVPVAFFKVILCRSGSPKAIGFVYRNEGKKQKLAEAATAECFYEYTMYLIFSMLNCYVRTQVKCAGGRSDMVVWMPDAVYVFELKVNGTAQEALEQIESNGYAIPYQADGRKLVKVGVKFNAETRVPEEWIVG
jgi:hypothetical protein